MNPQPPDPVLTQRPATANPTGYFGLALIVAATFVLYFVFGLYYVSHNAEKLKVSGDLWLKGEAYLSSFENWGTAYESDDAYYNRTAVSILQTGLPRDRSGALALHAPLYSYFLAACYAIGGFNRITLAISQSLVAALLAYWLGLAARRLVPQRSPSIMWIAAGLILVNLPLAKWTATVCPTLLLLLWVAWALHIAAGPLPGSSAIALGGVTLLAVFTQAAFFVVAAGFGLWLVALYARQRRLSLAVSCALIFFGIAAHLGAAAVAARAGATARSNKSLILWEANNPYYESMGPFALWSRRPFNPFSSWKPSSQDNARFDEYFKRGATSGRNPGVIWIRENPAQYVKLCWIRFYTSLGPFTGQMSARNRAISAFYWLLIFPAGFLGLWKLRHRPFAWLALLVFAALTAFETLVITEWQQRYRWPWELILILGASDLYAQVFSRYLRFGTRAAD